MWLWYLTGCHWRGMTHALTPNHMHADPHQHTHTHWPVKIHTLTTDHIHCPSTSYTDHLSHTLTLNHTMTTDHTHWLSITHTEPLWHTYWSLITQTDPHWSSRTVLNHTCWPSPTHVLTCNVPELQSDGCIVVPIQYFQCKVHSNLTTVKEHPPVSTKWFNMH